MAAKIGVGVVQIVNTIEGLFREWQQKATNLQNRFSQNQPVAIDVMANSGYHDARRALEAFDVMQGLITSRSWATEVRAEAVARHGIGYDIVAEAQAFRALLFELQGLIVTACGGVDADGYIQGNYIKLSSTPPFFNAITPTVYAPVNAKLQQILESIES